MPGALSIGVLRPPSVLLRFRFSGHRWRSFILSERRVTILLAKSESTNAQFLCLRLSPRQRAQSFWDVGRMSSGTGRVPHFAGKSAAESALLRCYVVRASRRNG